MTTSRRDPILRSTNILCSSRHALVRFLHRRIEFPPGVPGFPVVEVVHLREYLRSGRGHRGFSLDPELGRLRRDDQDEREEDNRQNGEADGKQVGYPPLHFTAPKIASE